MRAGSVAPRRPPSPGGAKCSPCEPARRPGRPRPRHRDDQREGRGVRPGRLGAAATPARATRCRSPSPAAPSRTPAQVVDAALRVLRDAAAAARGGGAEIAGVSISTAMHALVGARPRRARDHAGRDVGRHARGRPGRAPALASTPDLHGRTGTPAHPMAPLPKLMWFREHEPGDVRGGRALGRAQGTRPRAARGDVGGRPLVRVGHGAHGTSRTSTGTPRRSTSRASARDRLGRLVPATERFELTPTPPRGPGWTPGSRSSRAAATGRSRTSASARSARGRGVLDRDERRAAPHRRAPGGRSGAAGVLLRPHARPVGRRRRGQQRRRRAAVGGRRARARPRRRRGRAAARRSRRRRRPGAPG